MLYYFPHLRYRRRHRAGITLNPVALHHYFQQSTFFIPLHKLHKKVSLHWVFLFFLRLLVKANMYEPTPTRAVLHLPGNPVCPNELMHGDEEDYQNYRYSVINRLKCLKWESTVTLFKTSISIYHLALKITTKFDQVPPRFDCSVYNHVVYF